MNARQIINQAYRNRSREKQRMEPATILGTDRLARDLWEQLSQEYPTRRQALLQDLTMLLSNEDSKPRVTNVLRWILQKMENQLSDSTENDE